MSNIRSTIEEARVFQEAYNICMGNLQELFRKHFDVFNKITSDYNISIVPEGTFKDGKEMTKEELHAFIDEKKKDY